MEMTTVKTAVVVVIILGCFAVLYPKIFHPLLLNMLGVAPSKSGDDMLNKLPPHLRKPNMGQARPVHTGGGPPDDMARHMRGGPHPGMRAAADMQKQASQGGGGGKGMMGVVLPMYAIGIVVYLIYTLSKVFGNKKDELDPNTTKKQRLQQINKGLSEVRYDAERKKFMYGERDSDGENDEFYDFRQNRRQQRDLEKLLYKADKEKISDLEMRALKRRLLETESQMTRILQAMETVTDKVQGRSEDPRGEEQYEYEEYDDEKENLYPSRPVKVLPRRKQNRDVKENDVRRRNVKVSSKGRPAKNNEQQRDEVPRRKLVKNDKPDKPKNHDMMNEYYDGQAEVQRKVQDLKEEAEQEDVDYSDDFEDQEATNSDEGEGYEVEDIGPQERYDQDDRDIEHSQDDDEDEYIPEDIHPDDSQGSQEEYGDSDLDYDNMQESQFVESNSAHIRRQNQPDYEEYYEDEADDLEHKQEVSSSEGEGCVIGDESAGEDDGGSDKHSELRKRVVKKKKVPTATLR